MGICMNTKNTIPKVNYFIDIEDQSKTDTKQYVKYSNTNAFCKKSSSSLFSNDTTSLHFVSSCSNSTSFINTENDKKGNSVMITVIKSEKNSPILNRLKLRNKKNLSPILCERN